MDEKRLDTTTNLTAHKLNPEIVLDLRRRFVQSENGITVEEIQKLYSMRRETVQLMLSGRTYKDVPEPVARELVYLGRTRSQFTDDQVLAIRLKCIESNGKYGTFELMGDYNLTHKVARELLLGRTFEKIKPHVPAELIAVAPPVKGFTDSEVVSYRKKFKEQEGRLTIGMISKEMGIPCFRVSNMLRGVTHSHIPGEVTEIFGVPQIRKLTDECALFIRLIYKPGVVGTDKLSKAYKTSVPQIRNVLKGRVYKHVPFFEDLVDRHWQRKFSEDRVLKIRELYAKGDVSIAELARRTKTTRNTMLNMIRGRTYSHLPGSTPLVKKRNKHTPGYRMMCSRNVNKKPQIIKIRPVRMLDHDERIDHCSAA